MSMQELNQRNRFFGELVGNRDLVWMGQNTMHHEPHPDVLAALQECIARREFQMYAPPLGLDELRTLVLDDLGLVGAEAIVTDGAVSGLYQTCAVLGRDASQLIATDPGWPWPSQFLSAIGKPGVVVDVYSERCGYKLQADQLRRVLKDRSLIYLIDPLNPLGSAYSHDELRDICGLARQSRSTLIHDCTYRHFSRESHLAATFYPEGTVTTYSFSKWLGLAGMRVGALVGSADLIARLAEAPPNSLGSNIMAQRAAIAGLRNKQQWLHQVRGFNLANQAIIAAAVQASGLGEAVVYPSNGNFMSIDLTRSGWDSEQLGAELLRRGFFVRAGTYQSKLHGHRFVKISTSVPKRWASRLAEELLGLSMPETRTDAASAQRS
jgi:aspartate/methionine/tyrosine aminotransferase